jgi:hypothetical protein
VDVEHALSREFSKVIQHFNASPGWLGGHPGACSRGRLKRALVRL